MASHSESQKEQEENTAKLVMNTFYKVPKKDGVTPADITKFLQDKFGDVWRTSILTSKAEATLKRSAALGFLDKQGDRYVAIMAKGMACGCRRRRRRRCGSRRRGRCGCRRRRRRRRCR